MCIKMQLSKDEIELKNTLKDLTKQLIDKYQQTFDEKFIKHIIPNLREYVALVCKEHDIPISSNQLKKISKLNFHPLVDFAISGNIGYIRDYVRTA